MRNIGFLFIAFVLFNCSSNKGQEDEKDNSSTAEVIEKPSKDLPELLEKALVAHGGLDTWNQCSTLEYRLSSTLGGNKIETQLINLRNRKVRISGEGYVLGMDGNNVWVSPNKEAFGSMSARFYHNLIFYFFSIPFVLADDGINYEDLGTVTVMDTEYRALKVSYNEGVGDADDDFYIAHFNPETFRLELLLYTVTYYSGEKHENYNALKYTQWQEVNGVYVPATFEGYKYEDGIIGDLRYKTDFDQVTLKEEAPEDSIFELPSEAEIDTLIVH